MNVRKIKKTVSVLEVAKYLLSLDPKRQYFTSNIMLWENSPTEGNFRLNKMLHMCQIFHCAKYSTPLFKERMEAFEHGAIVYNVYMNFRQLYNALQKPVILLTPSKQKFIRNIYHYFKKSDDSTLRDFSHEDPAWELGREKNGLMPLNEKLIAYYAKFFDDTLAEIEGR